MTKVLQQHSGKKKCYFIEGWNKNKLLGTMDKNLEDGLFTGRIQKVKRINRVNVSTASKPVDLTHETMAHVQKNTDEKMISSQGYKIDKDDKPTGRDYMTFEHTKQVRKQSNGDLINISDDTTIHAVVCEPFQNVSLRRNRYLLVMMTSPHLVVAGPSRLAMRCKSTCLICIAWIDWSVARNITRMHTDSAKKFLALQGNLRRIRITPTSTSPCSPQAYGLFERTNRTILDNISALLSSAGLSEAYWGKSALHAPYSHNCTVISVIKMKTAHEVLLRKKSKNCTICIFGCNANFPVHMGQKAFRSANRAQKNIYVGAHNGQYRVYAPSTTTTVETNRVSFSKRNGFSKIAVFDAQEDLSADQYADGQEHPDWSYWAGHERIMIPSWNCGTRIIRIILSKKKAKWRLL